MKTVLISLGVLLVAAGIIKLIVAAILRERGDRNG